MTILAFYEKNSNQNIHIGSPEYGMVSSFSNFFVYLLPSAKIREAYRDRLNITIEILNIVSIHGLIMKCILR